MRVFIAVLLLVVMAQIGFAELAEKKAELSKVLEYIDSLDAKIVKAREEKKINKIAELKELKRKALLRAKDLKQEIADLRKKESKELEKTEEVKEKTAPKEPAPQKEEAVKKQGWQVETGYGGGALISEAGYIMPMKDFDLIIEGGLGIGGQGGSYYYIINVGAEGVMPLGSNYAGLELGLVNFSETVADIPLVSGNIGKGAKLGLGIFGGTKLEPVDVFIGYNTAYGLKAGVVYKF